MNALIDDRALLDDDEDDVSFDEETGEVKGGRDRENGFDDSSEEEEDDAEEEQRIRDGFIVDEDEDEDPEARRKRRREKRKRSREDREEEDLDEDDLELIGLKPQREETQSKFKRLKRGPREADEDESRGIEAIFADEDDVQEERRPRDRRGLNDEFDDFIEEDVFSDDEREREQDDREVARATKRGPMDFLSGPGAEGLDEQALEDFRAAFGDGTDYDFALNIEAEDEANEAEKDRHLDLKDVFEPSQLKEKLLTEEDNLIRYTDEPERHQLARKPYKDLELTEDEFREESKWIAGMIKNKVSPMVPSELSDIFEKCVHQVLEFLVRDDFEVPFIWINRKDYLIHVDTEIEKGEAHRLLGLSNLWDIFEHDLKFRALIERRRLLKKVYDELTAGSVAPDIMFETLLPQAVTMDELQDLHDYIYFHYAAEIKDLALTSVTQTNGVGISQKKASVKSVYEDIRSARAYNVVKGFGITPTAFAQNIARDGPRNYAEDPSDSPADLADANIDTEFPTGERVLKAARAMFVEELVNNPRLRKHMRGIVYGRGLLDCLRTDKGLRKIDESHPYYEFKYLRNQDFGTLLQEPGIFLKMLKAEEEGLVELKLRIMGADGLKKDFASQIKTDNYSNVADAWNREREQVVAYAFDKIVSSMSRMVKENLKNDSEAKIAEECRHTFDEALDQAPYQPRGMHKGTTPKVLTMSIGNGTPGRDPIYWTFVNDDGRPLDSGQLTDLAGENQERMLPWGKDVDAFVEIVERNKPEVIGVAGFTPSTRKVLENVRTIIHGKNLVGPTYIGPDDRDQQDLIPLIIVNDEVARLYHTSEKARKDHPGWAQLSHYCFALARYLQDPLQEYASLGRDVISLNLHEVQHLVPQEKLLKKLEMALIDKVNMVCVQVNETPADIRLANLLPYIAGLGPRKAAHLLKVINLNGGYVRNREELVVNDHQAMGAKVWHNAASFLWIEWEDAEEKAEYLDRTRVHPEDYDIARKMAADALELDEEDIEAERQEYGTGAIVRRLVREEAQDRVNDLVLEEYAVQLERNLGSRKRSTLEAIRDEFNDPVEELRRPFNDKLRNAIIFTMLTGDTDESLQVGMNVPVSLKRIQDADLSGELDNGMTAIIEAGPHIDSGTSPKMLYSMHQTVQAHIISIAREEFTVRVSLREDDVKKPFKRFDPEKMYKYDEWDSRQEAADKRLLEQKSETGMRATRVIKHSYFRPFNSKQAEEYLGSQNRGDVVVRPSSKGADHLAVTWKVADGVFQHIDVLELDKENEFALGKQLRVGGKYTYSDLDELIVSHVRTMSKKVDEMMGSDKYQDKTRTQLGEQSAPFSNLSETHANRFIAEWLDTYTAANPKRSMYQFCLNRERPGYFHLVFKAGQKAKLQDWSVKIIPNGFELRGQQYPDMRGLTNGFKLLFGNMVGTQAALGGR
jgi:transcription elongation factor SPT6